MTRIVNPYTVRPMELEPGDVMVRTVALHVLPGRDGGWLFYRMYVCDWPDPRLSDGVPQGTRMEGKPETMMELFPVVGYAGANPDPM